MYVAQHPKTSIKDIANKLSAYALIKFTETKADIIN